MGHKTRKMRPLTRPLDRFAEALAQTEGTRQDGDVMAVALKLGYAPTTGNGYLQRIRAELGPQAR